MSDGSKFGVNFGRATTAAASWCVVFALLHLYWAVGGSAGLASSAGHDRATRRPANFVAFGLFGVAAILLVGTAVILVTAAAKASKRRSAAIILLFGVGIVLVLRGVGLEVVLAMNVGGVRQQIGPLETRWSQILWNPWFAIGGCLVIESAIEVHRAGRSQ